MSLRRVVTLLCDCCRDVFAGEYVGFRDVLTARNEAHRKGWTLQLNTPAGKRDLCPACSKGVQPSHA